MGVESVGNGGIIFIVFLLFELGWFLFFGAILAILGAYVIIEYEIKEWRKPGPYRFWR